VAPVDVVAPVRCDLVDLLAAALGARGARYCER
jgi:hypothetical protein